MDINEFLNTRKEEIDAYLKQYLDRSDCPHDIIYDAVSYSVFAGGKRVRPIISLAVSDLTGGNRAAALAGGCAVEMIHTYSLIHDDLPCMDDDDFRRGKPSSHIHYGEAVAVLAGDALQAMAFECIAERVSPPEKAASMTRELAAAAGPEGMVGGQVLDLLAEKKPCTLDSLHTLHAMKTGALITASVRIGALAGECSDADMQVLTEFGRTAGLLFQVVDDILDMTGDFNKMGKKTGRDSVLQKSTFPALMGLDEAIAYRDTLREKACASIERFGERSSTLRSLCEFISERDH